MKGPLDQLLGVYGQDPIITAPGGNRTFSVIVRTQGRRPHSLNETLDCLAAQTHADHEVLVVVHCAETDDADASAARVAAGMGARADDDRVRILTARGGQRGRPLNVGLDAATGAHLCVVDDDDLVMDSWLGAFDAAASTEPGRIIRAVTLSQDWEADEEGQPRRAAGKIERPYPPSFDLLAHTSLNLTPICSLAFPLAPLASLGLRFDEDLPLFEDWDFLMRAAMALGVVSIAAETSLYRRLDQGNADTAEDLTVWHRTHAAVIDRLSAGPILLPAGDARRLAAAHFQPGGQSRHDIELRALQAELDALTRSPVRLLRAFAGRLAGAVRHRIEERRP